MTRSKVNLVNICMMYALYLRQYIFRKYNMYSLVLDIFFFHLLTFIDKVAAVG